MRVWRCIGISLGALGLAVGACSGEGGSPSNSPASGGTSGSGSGGSSVAGSGGDAGQGATAGESGAAGQGTAGRGGYAGAAAGTGAAGSAGASGAVPDGAGGAGGNSPDGGAGRTGGAGKPNEAGGDVSKDAPACPSTATMNVSSFGDAYYVIDGATNNPPLTLCRGATYTFALNVPGHPFAIETEAGALYTTGVTGNGNTSGQLVFIVPQSAPDKLRYQCSIHSVMTGLLTIAD